MQADTYCEECLAAVRRCRTLGGGTVLVDTRLEREGTVWLHTFREGQPVVTVASSPEKVPEDQVLRYRIHQCPR